MDWIHQNLLLLLLLHLPLLPPPLLLQLPPLQIEASGQLSSTTTHLEFKAKGDTFLAQSFYHILLGDWISVYLAELNEVDDVEVKVIDFLKAELAKI